MLKAVSGVALPIVITTLLILAVTGRLFAAIPVVTVAQLLAVGLAVWARRSFPQGSFRVVATPGGGSVLRSGPYRLIRHPMYTGALLLVWSGVLAHLSAWTGALGAVVTGVVVVRVIVEERLLRQRFPDYVEYMRTTKALVPFIA